jgi:isopenicillin-N N-acyltransferase-like protein
MNAIPVIDVGGCPGERGLTHGRGLADGIDRFYDRWMTVASSGPRPIAERDAVAFALGLLPESRAQAPDLVEEVEGIAEGAGLPFEKVWFLNCFDEAAGYWLYRQQHLGRACTTFAATGRDTLDGVTYVGQSWDINEWYESVLLRIAPGDGELGALTYTHPGVVGGMGINASGVALVWNSLQPTDQRHGVPVPFLVHSALRQPKLSDAIAACLRPVRAIGFNFILGAGFGAVNIEASARRQHVTYIGRPFAHGNHYETPELLALEGNPSYEGSSFVRAGRMRQLLDAAAGSIDLETCQDLLRDHANYPGSICAHLDPPDYPYMTKAAVVFEPGLGAMHLTSGPPCETPFITYRVGVAAVAA